MNNYYTMHMDELYTISLKNNQALKVYKKRLAEIRNKINYVEEDNNCGIMFNATKNRLHNCYENDYAKRHYM